MMNRGDTMIDTACRLGRSLRLLGIASSNIAVAKPGENRADAENDSLFDFGMTSIVLYALIVELTIKALWSIENHGKEPERTHCIERLFDDLRDGTRAQVEAIYASTCEYYEEIVSEGIRRLGREEIRVELASLAEALQWNAKAMVNLKYDLKTFGKTVPAGAMWDSETDWFFPEMTVPNFGLRLVDWAADELRRRRGD